jgi:hypothetical protein
MLVVEVTVVVVAVVVLVAAGLTWMRSVADKSCMKTVVDESAHGNRFSRVMLVPDIA